MTKIFIHESEKVSEHEAEDKIIFLMGYFRKWRKSTGVYRNSISPENKIALSTVADVINFSKEEIKVLHVVVFPELGLISASLLAATFLPPLFSKKSKKDTSTRNTAAVGSPNNGLSDRENISRIKERIPDIYGKVRSVPDLITPPYTVYINNRQVEYSLSVIGRGDFLVEDIRDGETLLSQITGASAEVYAPGGYPSGSYLTVGTTIPETIVAVKKSNSVNGQKLLAPNANFVTSLSRFRFFPDGIIEVDNSINPDEQPAIDFTQYFAVDDPVNVTGHLIGTYTVTSVTATQLGLAAVNSVNGNWATLPTTGYQQVLVVYISTTSDKIIGPFVIENSSTLYCNFVAENGLYKDSGEQQFAIAITLSITTQEVNSSDVPFGAVSTRTVTISGSAQSKSRIAITFKSPDSYATKRFRVSVKRVTPKNLTYVGEVNDEITWESLYGVDAISTTNFADLTVVKSATFASNNSLALKSRKLNMLVTRKLPILNSDGTFAAAAATSNFVDIVMAICKDARIGNLADSQIDKIGIFQVGADVASYFGTTKAREFNYTFDDANLSFEEILSIVAETVHCSVYRQGAVVKMTFEKSNNNSRILFNHRNKIPGSETRIFTFGNLDDHDGVEVKYQDLKDGSELTYYLPIDQSAINPLTVDIAGITNKIQAYFHAHRRFNKILYGNTVLQFEATQEANLLVRGDRILVADNTRPETFDGEILAKDGLLLTLSEEFAAEAGESYSIFLQLADATIESIPITPITNSLTTVLLDYNPSMPLAIGISLYAACCYEIVKASSLRKRAFVVENKEPQTTFNSVVTAYNYDSRYYDQDNDYLTNVVNIDGNLTNIVNNATFTGVIAISGNATGNVLFDLPPPV